MLKVNQVSKSYRRKRVLSECSFELGPYQVMGIFGHNGCGKSTLFRIIAGIIQADQGTVEVQRDKVGYMPEQRSLIIDLSLRHQARFMGILQGMSEELIEHHIDDLGKTFDFLNLIDKPLKTLSKGNQQKAQLILAMMKQPNVLILDEPFNGLDYHSQIELSSWIRSYAQKGNAVLISSHQLDHMNGLCDEILILDHGKTIRQGRLQSLRENFQIYSVKVNSDSNWKDFTLPFESIKAIESLIEYRFSSLTQAKRAVSVFLKDRSVSYLRMEMVALSELIPL